MSSKNLVDLRGKRPASARRVSAPARVQIANPAARTSPLRVKRRRARVVIFVVCAVLIGIIAFELSYVSYLPRYTISALAVEGTHTLSPQLVERYVETQLHTGTHPFFAPNNIFLYRPRDIESNVVGFFPRIRSVKVSRASLLANAITVQVEERQEFALWCTHPGKWGEVAPAGCYSMDDTGFIFATASSSSKNIFSGGVIGPIASPAPTDSITSTSSEQVSLPQVNPIGRSFAPGRLPGILALFDRLGQIGLTPTGASIDDNGADFVVPLTQGFDVKASFGQDTEALIRNLQLILSAEVLKDKQADIQYIDLRFGDRAYYKLKGSGTVSTSTAAEN
jgi:cell division septal protein FtsQ